MNEIRFFAKKMAILIFILGICTVKPVNAAVYHIDPTVASSGSGTASNPFKSWADLPAMQTGDDVYFKCRTTFNLTETVPYFDVDWTGTASNYVVIGAYYMNGGSPVYGVNGTRPIINGGWDYPAEKSTGMIRIRNKDYVKVENIHIYHSFGRGISVEGDRVNNAAYCIIDNVWVEGTGNQAIIFVTNPNHYGQVINSEIEEWAYGWYAVVGLDLGDEGEHWEDYCTKGFTGGNCKGAGWPAGVTDAHSVTGHWTVNNNYLHEGWGEGISLFAFNKEDIGHATITDNVVFSSRRVPIYLDNAHNNVIARNIVIGRHPRGWSEQQGAYTLERAWNQNGITIGGEDYNGCNMSHDNDVYNNLVAGCSSGIKITSQCVSSSLINNRIFNNTLVGNAYNFNMGSNFSESTASGNELKNNIFVCQDSDLGNTCFSNKFDPSWFESKIDADHNAWSGSIPTYTGDIVTDVIVDESLFPSGLDWQDIQESDVPGIVDWFRLQHGAITIDAGTDLGPPYNTDLLGTSRPQGTGWDMGAIEYAGVTGIQPVADEKEVLTMDIYPNPSSIGTIAVLYELPASSVVTITILDSNGRTMKTLFDKQDKGRRTLQVNTGDYTPGIYFCKLIAEDKEVVEKFLVK